MGIKDFNERLGAAIDKAAERLPPGYLVEISVESGGSWVWLKLPNGALMDIEGENIIDDIEVATAKAVDLARQQQDGNGQ